MHLDKWAMEENCLLNFNYLTKFSRLWNGKFYICILEVYAGYTSLYLLMCHQDRKFGEDVQRGNKQNFYY